MSNYNMGFEPKFDDNKKEGIIYIGKENKNSNDSKYRSVELIIEQDKNYLSEKNKDSESIPENFVIKEDVVLYVSDNGQQKIHCWLIESTNGKYTTAVRISRRTAKGVYGSQEVCLTMKAVIELKTFLNNIFILDTSNKSPFKIPISELGAKPQGQCSQILSEKEFTQLIKANIKNTDDFYKLLSVQKMEIAIKELEKIISGNFHNEVSIQKFLKENIWMFGNDYVFIVEQGKINADNILDLIPRNFESYIDIIEVKLPREKLFNYDQSHNNLYSSSDLTKAIAQTQNYIFELEKKTVDQKYQESNNCKIIRPKGIVLFGSNTELSDEEKQYLRILNSSYHNLQIITYQQLLEKAKNTISFYNKQCDK